MIQDAINTLVQLQGKFNNTHSIEVFANGLISIYYIEKSTGEDVAYSKNFANVQEVVEWMEDNLTEKK